MKNVDEAALLMRHASVSNRVEFACCTNPS